MSGQITLDDLNDPLHQHMRRDVTTLRRDQTVGEALAELRNPHLSDRIVYLYVLDLSERVVGVVPVRRLLMSTLDTMVGDIMVKGVVSVPDTATVLRACELFLEHHFLALPVVSPAGRLLGVVDLSLFTDEILALARRSGRDNVFQLIGVHLALGRRVPPWSSFKERFPWLLTNVASGTICAFIVAGHEALLRQVAILAVFFSVVLALAESVSMQTMTLMFQAMVDRRLSFSRLWGALQREFLVAAMLGLGGGGLVGVIVYAWRHTLSGALAVGGTIWLSMMSACLLGVAVPAAIRALRVDPKVAAGPIVLAAADITTLLFYFGLAQWLLG